MSDTMSLSNSEWKETEVGRIPTSWQSLPIGDFGDVTKLAGFEYTKHITYVDDGEIIALRALNVRNGNLDLKDIKRIYKDVSDGLIRSKLFKGDILLTYVGANIGQFALIPENDKFHLAPNICRIRCGEKCDPYFLYSYFRTDFFKNSLEGFSHGSSQPTMPMGSIRQIPIPIPPLPEQKAIAEVLSSLDDKIDLLHRQNKTLEQIAETLFRQWFVEEAKEDWEYVTLDDYVTCYNGVSYKSSELNPSETAMVTLKSFARGGGFRLDGFKEFTGKYKETHIVKQGDIAVAHTDITQDAALVGNPVLIVDREEYKILVISMDLVKVEPIQPWMSKAFLYYLMKTRSFKQHCLGHANGSTVLHLSKNAIPSFEFFLPPVNKIKLFTDRAANLLGKKNMNISQIRTLEKMRDTLLPKLISGEVRIV